MLDHRWIYSFTIFLVAIITITTTIICCRYQETQSAESRSGRSMGNRDVIVMVDPILTVQWTSYPWWTTNRLNPRCTLFVKWTLSPPPPPSIPHAHCNCLRSPWVYRASPSCTYLYTCPSFLQPSVHTYVDRVACARSRSRSLSLLSSPPSLPSPLSPSCSSRPKKY